MKRTSLLFNIIIVFAFEAYAQEEVVVLETGTGTIEGTLLVPPTKRKLAVALIIAGSGPTDRDGNNSQMKNNSLKMLADGLAVNGIASLRYDKRGVGASKEAAKSEVELRFEDYINDAKLWADLLVEDKRFKKIIIIGHSEGSLIGMIASQQESVNKFVSLAGVGRPAGEIIREQLSAQPAIVIGMSEPILKSLENGETIEGVPVGLYSLFRPSVQPYMISWFRYDPQKEIAKLNIPILIVQGTTDIQVTEYDAELLVNGNPKAKRSTFEGMNHILKEADLDTEKNIETYNNPDLPLAKGLMPEIVSFINEK